ncbi:TlpA family protein disulfide reductase [Olivibacter sitiensis]|uniref:TlpA family protein disulfide reductase n=1 Tax=Olivibacter sitiensis TaxID=376470 RepID=UPI00040D8D90|nr:TlpA disulfide reductase family protein [Olivibacter sitiensis]
MKIIQIVYGCFAVALCMGVPKINLAQDQSLAPVKFGEQVPDFKLEGLVNSEKTSVSLSDLKGKLVILDFFGTWCGSCIPGIPKLDSLQKVFGNQIQVIVLCHDKDIETVDKFIKQKWSGLDLQIPFALAKDSTYVANQLFPHRMVPHEVWISPEGKLLYTTDFRDITYANIKSVLEGRLLPLTNKEDQIQFDRSRPIFENGNLRDLKPLMAKTGFSHYIPGLPGVAGNEVDTTLGTKRIYYTYSTVEQLYQRAVAFRFNPDNRTIWRVKDMENYVRPAVYDKGWEEKNLYCIEVTLPLHASTEDWTHYFLQTINTNLRLNGHLEKIRTSCYALVPLTGRDTIVISTKGNTRRMSVDNEAQEYVYSNMPLDIIINNLNYKGGPIIVDGTGVKGHVDLRRPMKDNASIEAFRASFQKQGLDLVLVERELDFLVIEEPGYLSASTDRMTD